MTMPEVEYVMGYPPYVKGSEGEGGWRGRRVLDTSKDLEKGQHIEDYSSWSFDQIDVDFDGTTKTVNEIACNSIEKMGCPALLGLQDGLSEEAVFKRLGKPSYEQIDGVTKTVEYESLGTWFYLAKNKIYPLGVKTKETQAPACKNASCEP
jgi:hypothetical protein